MLTELLRQRGIYSSAKFRLRLRVTYIRLSKLEKPQGPINSILVWRAKW